MTECAAGVSEGRIKRDGTQSGRLEGMTCDMKEWEDFIRQAKNQVVEFWEELCDDDIVIFWGNGAHVRFYLKYFEQHGRTPDYIVDRNAPDIEALSGGGYSGSYLRLCS